MRRELARSTSRSNGPIPCATEDQHHSEHPSEDPVNTNDEGHCSLIDGTVEIEQNRPSMAGLLELRELAEAAKIQINGRRPVTGIDSNSLGNWPSTLFNTD